MLEAYVDSIIKAWYLGNFVEFIEASLKVE